MYTLEMQRATSVSGKPHSKKRKKVKDTPERSARPATTRLAEAPIRVKLPPRHAPKESDHQRGSVVAAS
jgi:hypothetical protein